MLCLAEGHFSRAAVFVTEISVLLAEWLVLLPKVAQ